MLSGLVHLARLARVGFVMAREGALGLIDPAGLPPAARGALWAARLIERRNVQGSRLVHALTRLGPTYVKLGQFLATRPDVVGIAVARELEALQDRMAPFPDAQARAIVEKALGKPVSEAFESFSEPVAAASVAQVHKATLRGPDGATHARAVKVMRPGVRARFATDIQAMLFIGRMMERFSEEARRLHPVASMLGFERSVMLETDFRLEAAALSELAENTRNDHGFRTPAVDWERTGREVLVTEWIDGVPLSDRAAVAATGHDLPVLARAIMQSFLRQALRDGFFHADMHQGNLFVDAQGDIVAVDCGIMGRLGFKERRVLAEILYGFITRDYMRVAEVHFEAGYVPANHSVAEFAQAIRAIGEPIHDRPASEISMAKLLTLLFEITGLFDMHTRTELVLLQKTMIVVEGVSRGLDPDFDMWATSEPVIREWIERNLGPLGQFAEGGKGLRAIGRAALDLPDMLARIERIATQAELAATQGVQLSAASVEAIGQAEARRNRWNAAALWIIAGLLALAILR